MSFWKNIRGKEGLFWFLQLIGWTMLNSTFFLFPFGFSRTYLIYGFIVATIIGIGVTTGYRFYIRKHITTDNITKKGLLKLLIAFLVCSICYFGFTWISEYVYDMIFQRTAAEEQWFKDNVTWIGSAINIAVVVFGWTLIYFVINFVFQLNKNNLESLELNATLREAQLNTLKGQVNPHFMFNSLNNIRGLMLEDVSKSREMITKLSEMLQYALVKNTVDAIPLQEELDMVDNYIALSKIQMEDRLTYEKEVQEDVLTLNIPPMIVQLLVENAAKHGIANLKDGGRIAVKIYKAQQELLISVTNTGKLSISKDSTQLGIKNIKQRLGLLYGTKGSFSLTEEGDEVVALIKIPLQ